MKRINITNDPIQDFNIEFENELIATQVRFFPVAGFWTISIEYKGKKVNFKKLSLGIPHMISSNLPFDFIVRANDGLDPYDLNDFSTRRCDLVLAERVDIENFRGVALP